MRAVCRYSLNDHLRRKASTINVTMSVLTVRGQKFTQEMMDGMRAYKNKMKILAVRQFKVIGGPPRRGNIGKQAYLLTYLLTQQADKNSVMFDVYKRFDKGCARTEQMSLCRLRLGRKVSLVGSYGPKHKTCGVGWCPTMGGGEHTFEVIAFRPCASL